MKNSSARLNGLVDRKNKNINVLLVLKKNIFSCGLWTNYCYYIIKIYININYFAFSTSSEYVENNRIRVFSYYISSELPLLFCLINDRVCKFIFSESF